MLPPSRVRGSPSRPPWRGSGAAGASHSGGCRVALLPSSASKDPMGERCTHGPALHPVAPPDPSALSLPIPDSFSLPWAANAPGAAAHSRCPFGMCHAQPSCQCVASRALPAPRWEGESPTALRSPIPTPGDGEGSRCPSEPALQPTVSSGCRGSPAPQHQRCQEERVRQVLRGSRQIWGCWDPARGQSWTRRTSSIPSPRFSP